MIIRIIAAGRQVEIDDAGNFKAFSVRIEGRSTIRRSRLNCSVGSL